jgi:restriction system protein
MRGKEIVAECSSIKVTHTATGLARYEADVYHEGLDKFLRVRGNDVHVVKQKARTKMNQWNSQWQKRCEVDEKRRHVERVVSDRERKKELAAERTAEAQQALELLGKLLEQTLSIDDTVDWNSLKTHTRFDAPQPRPPASPAMPVLETPSRPDPDAFVYQPDIGLIDRLFASRKERKIEQARQRLQEDLAAWQRQVAELETAYQRRVESIQGHFQRSLESYQRDLAAWQRAKAAHEEEQAATNRAVDERRQRYLAGDAEAVSEYCELVLSSSQYPEYFPQEFAVQYRPEPRMLIVEYQLPDAPELPALAEVKYVQSRDDFSEKFLSQNQAEKIYDSVIYQIALRTIHELFEADAAKAIDAIVFNGHVQSIDAATGHKIRPCIVSLQASKTEFEAIALERVEPKACFKKLKGVAAARLHSITPVAPIVELKRDDSRFVSSYAVIETLDEGENLAAMDWEDFEHLIRELFERAFAQYGGEVKVTRASRDGGVDAVIFDPDPLRGGKTVIQAKRYTNTVSVSAVRELFGTLQDEGAIKGILVTTADFGKDAYEFALGKPLKLINGAELLHMLHSHGHKARIDLKEAKAAARSS